MSQQTTPISKIKRPSTKSAFRSFLNNQYSGGIVLLVFASISIIAANFEPLNFLTKLWDKEIGFSFGSFELKMSLLHWVNDGLMVLFFFSVGLEIKRELVIGELSSIKHASLPIVAALGGMIFPALIYLAFNYNTPTQNGWGIPMATDIAFAIGIISLMNKRVPLSLKVFLTALAIVDDLGAIVVIAIFYPTHSMNLTMLLWASAIMIILIAMNRKNVQHAVFYILPGLLLWLFILKSGIHSTIAGVLIAMTIPLKMKENNITKNKVPLLNKMEHFITPIVSFIIVPVFALANAGVKFSIDLSGPVQNISKGIFFGLVFGKPIGIFLSSYVACKMGLANLPTNSNWKMLFSVGIIAGIGFTMSIFIDNLAFEDPNIVEAGKRAVLISSLTAAIIGPLIIYAPTKKTIETNQINKKNENN